MEIIEISSFDNYKLKAKSSDLSNFLLSNNSNSIDPPENVIIYYCIIFLLSVYCVEW